ncbi:hypothetical protein [Poseidonibacter antarcticus]|uniref:hypothetical protein n=1 Tax=Poseidonibacter antarcticus TaxID=2478538 RepID=UPI000EF535D8|nr:hypothetical protein [Poseidonibacter antarcticus]
MKTKLLIATALAAVLSTGVYAAGNDQGQGMMKKGMNSDKQSCHRHMKKGQMKGQKGPLSLIRQLNLTTDQHKQIRQIKQDLMKKRVTPNVAFTSNSFDKAKFIQIMKEKRDNKIELKAEMIDRVYNVLTSKQKEQFKVLMDLKAEKRMAMMEKRMNHGKNHNGQK